MDGKDNMKKILLLSIPVIVIVMVVLFSYHSTADAQSTCSTGIKKTLRGYITQQPFSTTSMVYVPSGFPTNPTFTKQYNESQIWVFFTLDHSNTLAGSTNYVKINIDDKYGSSWADDFASTPNLNAFSGQYMGTIPAGNHTISVDFATNKGTATLKTNLILLNIFEVCFGDI